MNDTEIKRKPGRPRSTEAYESLINATTRLMEVKAIRNITIGEIAKEAGVGKPTIYRWWDSKCALIMDAFLSSTAPHIPVLKSGTALKTLGRQIRSLIQLMNGRTGRIVAEIIGEGQSDPHIMEEFRNRFFQHLLDPLRAVINYGISSDEFDPDLDVELALDLIFGPVYYRLLLGHQTLDASFADRLITRIEVLLEK